MKFCPEDFMVLTGKLIKWPDAWQDLADIANKKLPYLIDWKQIWNEFDEITGDWLKDGDKLLIQELINKELGQL